MAVQMRYETPDGIKTVEREDWTVDGGMMVLHDLKEYDRDTVIVPRERVIEVTREIPDDPSPL